MANTPSIPMTTTASLALLTIAVLADCASGMGLGTSLAAVLIADLGHRVSSRSTLRSWSQTCC